MEEKEKTENTIDNQGHGEDREEHKEKEEHKKKKKDESIDGVKKLLSEKEEEIKGVKEKMLYLQADFENFKKLKAKERMETLKYGNEALIKEFIPVADNLELAISHASTSEECKGILEGVKLTLSEFMKVLERAGVTRIEAVGKKFDPNLHEAFYQEERVDMEPETVISEFQTGYLLNDRLIRPSRVILSKKPEIQ